MEAEKTMITEAEAKRILDQPLKANETEEDRIEIVASLLRPFSELQKDIADQAKTQDQ